MMSIQEKLNAVKNCVLLTCPYCGNDVTFKFSEPHVINLTELRYGACSTCKKVVIQVREFIVNTSKRFDGKLLIDKQFGAWVIIWPQQKVICSDVRIPEEIRKDLNDAASVVDISPDAAMSLVRCTVEWILEKHMGFKDGNLETKIKTAKAANALPVNLLVGLDPIRTFGKFATHSIDDCSSGERIIVTKEQVLFAIEKAKQIAVYWFITRVEDESMAKAAMQMHQARKQIK